MHQEIERHRWFRRRAVLVGAGTFGLFGALVGRLGYLQLDQGERYGLLSEANRVNQRLLVPPRGQVADRSGRPLAINVPTYRVRVVRELSDDLPATLARLAEVIRVEPALIEAVLAQVKARPKFVPVSVREDLDWDEVSRIAVRSPELPGVILDSGLVRRYPEGAVTGHVLGFVGPVSEPELKSDQDPLLQLPEFRIGKQGIERAYDGELRGRAGLSRIEVNAVGREIRELDRDEGEPGTNIELSLDIELQRFCAERLATETSAACAVVDVRDGGVLAMCSVPGYEPALFENGISAKNWAGLRDDPLTPLVNKAFAGEYPPGSTFKTITALAGLETGVITTATRIHCPGYIQLGPMQFHCWKKGGHGSVDVLRSLEQSCDVFHYEVARRLGIDRLADYARRFGLGERLELDLPGERAGLIPTVAWKKQKLKQPWHGGETLISGIGQGYVLATPLQLAVMTARLCNGARPVRPWLVKGGHRHAACCSAAEERIQVDPANLALVLDGMNRVVNGAGGTARGSALRTPGVRMAGKTGTSQVRRISKADRLSGAYKRKDIPWKQRDHALFIAFAPVDAPRYALAVVVEHGGGGSAVAAPVARDIVEHLLQLEQRRAAPPPEEGS